MLPKLLLGSLDVVVVNDLEFVECSVEQSVQVESPMLAFDVGIDCFSWHGLQPLRETLVLDACYRNTTFAVSVNIKLVCIAIGQSCFPNSRESRALGGMINVVAPEEVMFARLDCLVRLYMPNEDDLGDACHAQQ